MPQRGNDVTGRYPALRGSVPYQYWIAAWRLLMGQCSVQAK